MFNFFKSAPDKKIRKQYHAKLEEAMLAQRNGKIREYSFLTQEAEALREQLEALQNQTQS
jgi:polyhydroxyalkanoate synthesis regulator phasin